MGPKLGKVKEEVMKRSRVEREDEGRSRKRGAAEDEGEVRDTRGWSVRFCRIVLWRRLLWLIPFLLPLLLLWLLVCAVKVSLFLFVELW